MATSFDVFTGAFLNKITSYDYVNMEEEVFNEQADPFLFSACSEFENIFRRRTGLSFSDKDLEARQFNWDLPVCITEYHDKRLDDYITSDEVVDIISEGMLLKWLSGFLFSGDHFVLGNFLKTKDFSPYSPSNFISNMQGLYSTTKSNYKNMINEFSYNHGALHKLHM